MTSHREVMSTTIEMIASLCADDNPYFVDHHEDDPSYRISFRIDGGTIAIEPEICDGGFFISDAKGNAIGRCACSFWNIRNDLEYYLRNSIGKIDDITEVKDGVTLHIPNISSIDNYPLVIANRSKKGIVYAKRGGIIIKYINKSGTLYQIILQGNKILNIASFNSHTYIKEGIEICYSRPNTPFAYREYIIDNNNSVLHGEYCFVDIGSIIFYSGVEQFISTPHNQKQVEKELSRYRNKFLEIFSVVNISNLNKINIINKYILDYIDMRTVSERAQEIIDIVNNSEI